MSKLPPAIAGKVYIYGLIDPRTSHVRYIGKAANPAARLKTHIANNRKEVHTHKGKWIRTLLDRKLTPSMCILAVVAADAWEQAERDHIAHYRALGARLTNCAEGGVGRCGYTHSAQTRERLRQARRRRPPMNAETRARLSVSRRTRDPELDRTAGERRKGRNHSPEAIERMRVKAQEREARWRAQGGRPVSDVTRARLAEASTGRKQTPAQIEKSAAAKRGKKRPAEVVGKVSAALTGRKRSPESVAKSAAGLKGHSVSAETRAAIGAKVRAAAARRRQEAAS